MNPLQHDTIEKALELVRARDFLKAAQLVAKEMDCSIPYAMRAVERMYETDEGTEFPEIRSGGLPFAERS